MKTLPRIIGLKFLIIALSFLPLFLFSQIRIDKQQCFGGYGDEYSVGMVMEKDFIMLVGSTPREYAGTGHVPQDCANSRVGDPCWIMKINHDYEVIDSWCHGDMGFAEGIGFMFKIGDKFEYYLSGSGFPEICDAQNRNIVAKRINADGEEIWSRGFGTHNGLSYDHCANGELTHDGGLICHANYHSGGCDISQTYGNGDGWLVAIDSLGNMQWETTLGTAGQDQLTHVHRSSRGGYYAPMYNDPVVSFGSLQPCYEPVVMNLNATLLKLDDRGNIEWQECYGCERQAIDGDGACFGSIVDLEDGGLLCVGDASCNTGDLAGSGWHYGTLNNIPNGPVTSDVWLLRLDENRNIVWSRCYGGSNWDSASYAFELEDGGFMVFGVTYSIDGDVASAAHINLSDQNVGVGWMFRTDANGNLLWERCLGNYGGGGFSRFTDVVRHNDREYTIAGEMVCPNSSAYQGDIDCSNCAVTQNLEPSNLYNWDYWILHITDTVDYTTLQVPEQPMPMEEASVEVYPNPANKTVCVVLPNEAETTQMELVNMKGQVVAAKTFSGKSSWIEMGGLPQGMYALRIRNAEVCLARKVLRE